MAANNTVNKVIYGNNTLIDLTNDTVNADVLLSGYTAHDKSGALVSGSIAIASASDIRTAIDAVRT